MDRNLARRELEQILIPAAGEEAGLEAGFMLEQVLGRRTSRPVTAEDRMQLSAMVRRRLTGEPLQYILGEWAFMGLPMRVGPGALIPRPETELLCELALKEIKPGDVVLDLCCGTGCLGVALGKLGGAKVTFSDISGEALALARENARINGVEGVFLQGDLLEPVKADTFACILCNPPYLTETEMNFLQKELTFEPAQALYGGKDGLDFYRRLSREAAACLEPGGSLYMEIGCTQGTEVQALFPGSRVEKDLSGLDRMVIWTKHER